MAPAKIRKRVETATSLVKRRRPAGDWIAYRLVMGSRAFIGLESAVGGRRSAVEKPTRERLVPLPTATADRRLSSRNAGRPGVWEAIHLSSLPSLHVVLASHPVVAETAELSAGDLPRLLAAGLDGREVYRNYIRGWRPV